MVNKIEGINFNNFKREEKDKKNIVKENLEEISYNLGNISHSLTMKARKSGEPYFEGHSLKVADIILQDLSERDNFSKLNSDFSKRVSSVAYLHDVFEDTKLDEKWIEDLAGKDILEILVTLTENKELRKNLEDKLENNKITKDELKIEMLEDSLQKINSLKESDNPDAWEIAATVRIADILQNLSDFDKQKKDLQERNKAKAIIIKDEFLGKIDLANKLEERIKEIEENNL